MRLLSKYRRRYLRPAFELLEERIVLDGDLDSSFGTGGLVTTDILGRIDRVRAMAIQPDGKIVVAGSNGPSSGRQDFALVRYNADGTLDDGSASDATPGDKFASPFGGPGRVVTEMQVVGSDQISDLIIQPDGKIVVAGQATFTDQSVLFAVLRYNKDGSLDDGGPLDATPDDQFGTAGKVFVDFGSQYNLATAIARQSNGKLVIAGQVLLNESEYGFGLVRLNTDGSLDDGSLGDATPDDSFGVVGKVTTTFEGKLAGANDVVLQPDGKILAVGFASQSLFFSRFAVARYDLGGNLDTSFDGDGQAVLNFGLIGPSAAVLQADGKLIVAGAQGQNSALGRINADGSPDDGGPSDSTPADRFATAGSLITSFPTRTQSVVLQSDGKIVIAGSTGSAPNRDMALARYNSNGTLDDGGELDVTPDDNFGVAGTVSTNFGAESLPDDLSFALTMHTSGNLMVAGITGSDIAVARYHIDAGDVVPDSDADGVPNEIEMEAPNGGDGNQDGILDVNQTHVASLPNAVDGSYVTIVAPEGTRLKNVLSRDIRSIHSATFPLGAFAFELTDVGPDVATITLIPSTPVSPNCVFKFGPTSDDPVPHWYRFDRKPGASIGAELLADRVNLHLRDGDLGDDDRTANGVIVDDVAIAVDLADQVTVNGVVFHDVDGDGNFGGPFLNEAPLAGWTVFLDENANGLLDVDSTTSLPTEPYLLTGETGTYGFEGLERRTYTVTQIPPPGWISSTRFISRTIPGGTVPRSVAAGDFNSDGRTDLVVVENFQVSLLLRREDGTYEAPLAISDASADAVGVGHFNADTLPDIAVRGAMYVDVFLGLPSGEFTSLTALTLDGGGPNLLVAADLDQDGDDDLVVNSSDRAITVLRNDGVSSGSFSKLPPVDIGHEIADFAVGQLNFGSGPEQDAITDLAISSSAGKIVNILNIGTASQTVRETIVSGEPGNLAIGQFNESSDDHADIAYVDRETRRVRVLFGDGTGALELAPGDGHAVGEDPQSIRAADFNSDRVMDLSVVNTDSDDVSILTGVGNGTFLPEVRIEVRNSPLTQLVADVSGDGLPDLAVPNRASGTISILARDGTIGQSIKVRLGDRPIVYDAHFANQPIRGGSIRGTRWDDLDGNGTREPSEPGLAGQRVFLDVNQDGEITAGVDRAVATDDDGFYVFENMPPGEYRLIAELDPDSVQTFPESVGYQFVLVEGRHVDELDFGSRLKPGTIRGFVWDDQNGNGERDNADGDPFFDEPIQSDVTVFLDFNANGRLDPDEPSRVTGLTGEFVFAELPAGRTYAVAEVVPSGFVQSFPGSGRPVAQQVELAPDSTVLANFGNAAVASIRGTKWEDFNGNGVPDDGEPRAASVTVFVDLNNNGALDFDEPSGVTDSAGVYLIGNVPPGTHTVSDQAVRLLESPDSTVARSFGFSLTSGNGKIAIGDPHSLRVVTAPVLSHIEAGRVFVFDATSRNPLKALENPFPDGNEFFGYSLAISGNTLAVGSPGAEPIGVESFGRVHLFDTNTGEIPRYLSFGPVHRGDAGASLALVQPFESGPAFALGAPGTYVPGMVFLLAPRKPDRHNGDMTWGHVDGRELTANDEIAGVRSSFDPEHPEPGVDLSDIGASVAGVGNLVAAGDPNSDVWTVNTGIVKLFGFYSGELVRTITNPQMGPLDKFGSALASIFGFDLLVGAPGADLGERNTGAAYQFNPESGEQLWTFENPNPDFGDQFGFALASVGDYVVVGAPRDDTRGEDAGAAYVFNGKTGAYLYPIYSPVPQAGADFGFSITAVGADQILIGAPSVVDESDPGAAYLFDLGRSITTAPGQSLDQVDFATGAPVELPGLRGVAFHDLDQDGEFDSGEPPLANRYIFLDQDADQTADDQESFVRTDPLGNYEFIPLRPGTYHVVERLDSEWMSTDLTRSQTIVVTAGETTKNVNFGSRFVGADDDTDGIANAIEELAPNNGDGNHDGVADSEQMNVASFPAALGGYYLTLAAPSGTQLIDVSTSEELVDPEIGPFELGTPVGVLSFTLAGVDTGGMATVELFVESLVSIDSYYKFGTTPDNPTPHFYEFLFDGSIGAELFNDRRVPDPLVRPHTHQPVSRILLHLKDGDFGDDDPAPGRIHDPGGPTTDFVLPPSPFSPQLFANDTVLAGQMLTALLAFNTTEEDSFAAEIRWGDGITESFTFDQNGVQAWVAATHRYAEPGNFEIQATIQGANGFSAAMTHSTLVLPARDAFGTALLLPSAARPGTSMLFVGGSAADDRLQLLLDPDRKIQAVFNDQLLGTFSADEISLVVVLGHAGNDTLEVDPDLELEVVIFGGEGDDQFVARPENAAVVGGPGSDVFQLSASDLTLDLESSSSSTLASLETIDISEGNRNTLVVGVRTASAVSGSAGGLKILASDDDIVQLANGFKLEDPVFFEEKFFHVVSFDGADVLLGGLLPWQNPVHRLDVNADNAVSPIDALVIINELNSPQIGQLPIPPVADRAPPMYYDTTGDNVVAPIDVLVVINFLNGEAQAEAESAQNNLVGWVILNNDHVPLIAQTTFVTTLRSVAGHSLAPGWTQPASVANPTGRSRTIVPRPFRIRPGSQEERDAIWNGIWQSTTDWPFDALMDLVDDLAKMAT